MNADDFDRQWRLHEGVTPDIVNLLLQHGHLDTVVAAARSGEWFCAAGARDPGGHSVDRLPWRRDRLALIAHLFFRYVPTGPITFSDMMWRRDRKRSDATPGSGFADDGVAYWPGPSVIRWLGPWRRSRCCLEHPRREAAGVCADSDR